MKFSLLPFTSLLLSARPAFAQAQDATSDQTGQLASLITSAVNLVHYLLFNIILPASGGILVLMVIYGGVQMITGSQENGKKTVIAALTGAAIIILSGVILSFLLNAISGGNA